MPATLIGPLDDIGLLGAGTAFPALELDNAEVLARLPDAARRGPEQLAFAARGIEKAQGLRRRSWAHPVGEPLDHDREATSFDLAARAAEAALRDAQVSPSDLALIIVCTSTPHRMTSTLAVPLGAQIGAQAACMDLRTGCSAGIFALGTAALHVSAGAGPALVVGAETFSKVVPPTHKMGMLSLGDGAGALVVGRRPGSSVRAVWARSDGKLAGLIGTAGRMPPTLAEIDAGGFRLSGQPEALADALPARYLEALNAALDRADVRAADIDLYAPHQTSLPLIDAVAARAGVRSERVWREGVGRHANIGAAGWIVALAEACAEGAVARGDTVAVASVGGGMSWAAGVLTW